METRNELLEILSDLHPDIDFENEDELVTGKILDSFDLVSLVTEIDNAFEIEITAADLLPENFDSLDAITELVERKLEEF